MTQLPPPAWIETAPALQKLADDLARFPRLAVDTESNSLYVYREQLCLIQFSTSIEDALVDPLALKDLLPLEPIFSNPDIEKVFHAAEYDLICLKRDFGISVAGIFDTMQAARILGYSQVGLDSVLAKKLGVTMNKKYQKADWGERPLPVEMLNYARLDTHYLLELRDHLEAELIKNGRWNLASEEFVRLATCNGSAKTEVPAWQRVSGTHKFTDRQLTILHEVCLWREGQAKRMNRPAFKVIDDRRLAEIALHVPQTDYDLEAAGLTTRQITAYGNEILRAVKRGEKAPLVSRPHIARPKQAIIDRLAILSEWRKQAALKMRVESDLVLPKGWMHAIAEQDPKTMEELAALMPQSPWRLENFGAAILKAIHKNK
jgi:ribonuclease D